MEIDVGEGEDAFRFACDDTLVSRWVCQAILEGRTYPIVDLVDDVDVDVVVDAGANCGAASVFFARAYPGAVVHAFEPATRPRSLLAENVAGLANVQVHPFGLYSSDVRVPLYAGVEDTVTGSIHRRDINSDIAEEVELRDAGRWAEQAGIDHIDVLKVDVEGCEVEVLESLGADLLSTVKVLYVEYDSRRARRLIDQLIDPSHELYFAMFLALDQGECVYIRRDIADHPDAGDAVGRLLRGAQQG